MTPEIQNGYIPEHEIQDEFRVDIRQAIAEAEAEFHGAHAHAAKVWHEKRRQIQGLCTHPETTCEIEQITGGICMTIHTRTCVDCGKVIR